MAGWFDEHAMKSARASTAGVSRRRVLVGGSAVAATWTAPMLMASSAAAAGLSACTGFIVTCPNNAPSICCPISTDVCGPDANGTLGCRAAGSGGGSCGNSGQGICTGAFKCNGNSDQCNSCTTPNRCGGEGAQCCVAKPDVAGCFGNDLVCTAQGDSGAAFCRKTCSATKPCATGQICDGGVCAETCTASSQCLGRATCTGTAANPGVCLSQEDGGLSRTCAAA